MAAMKLKLGAVLVTGCVISGAATAGASPQGANAARHRSHGSCGSFCRQAGGLGGNPQVAPCHVLSGRIRVRDGIAPVSVRCAGKRLSRGAVVIYPHNVRNLVSDGIPRGSYDGVDLVGRPGRKITVRILLSPKAQALLERKHRLLVDVLVELKGRPVKATSRVAVPLVLG